MFGDTVVACLLATTVAFGLSAGMSEIAVSTLSVLAGRYQPCGSLAASTCPVPASAMTHAEALIFGSRGTARDGKLTSTPRPESCAPPITGPIAAGDGDDAAAGAAIAAAASSAAAAASTLRMSLPLSILGRPPAPKVTWAHGTHVRVRASRRSRLRRKQAYGFPARR